MRHIRRLFLGIAIAVAWCPTQPIMAADPAACTLARLSTAARIGQILMVSVPGTAVTPAVSRALAQWKPAGIILFSGNITSASKLKTFIWGLQHRSTLPMLISVDQEGGVVARVRVGLIPLPSEAYYGKLGSADRVFSDTRSQGRALKSLGINLNLAPVADVLDTPSSAIGSRSFGPDPATDAALAAAAVRGYQAAGIGATAKHFLALGSARVNADYALPVVADSRATLERRDMVPFRAVVSAGVDALMVTRVLLKAFDPATAAYASPIVVQGVIRTELGYRGLIMTDSLLSNAVISGPGPVTAALAALAAGDDLLLFGSGAALNTAAIDGVIAALTQAVASGTVSKTRLDDATLHVLRLKARLGLLPRCH